MQLTMWPSLAALVAVSVFLPVTATSASLVGRGSSSQGVSIWRRSSLRHNATREAPVGVDAAQDAAGDAAADAEASVVDSVDPSQLIGNSMASSTACSCDCCEVQKLLPASFVKKPNGQQVTSKCWKATVEATDMSEASQSICPSQCQLANDDQILTAARGQVDYNRFCEYNCQPVTDAIGTACVQFDKKWYQEAAADGSGNGKEVWPEPVMGLGSGYAGPLKKQGASAPALAVEEGDSAPDGGGAGPEAPPPAAPEEEAKKEAAAKAEQVNIVYDMRKLISERLRAEAGANVAAAAAAAERVRSNEWKTKENSGVLKKLRTRFAAIGGKVEEGVVGVEADTNAADEAEKKTKLNLVEGRLFSSTMVKEVRKLTDEAIKKAVEPCSELAARNRAQAKGLDKPKDWVKVVAARAANPYMKAVTDSVTRTSEYKNLADSLMAQAYGAQKQANTLVSHVNVLQAQGDIIGATIEKKQVTNLLARAKSLSAEAAGYWNTAQSTRETIPKWQMAAAQAAAYAAWEYSNNAKAFR